MKARDGRIHLPTGVSYRYLVLPGTGKLTLPTARKVEELRRGGAAVYMPVPIEGTPGLEGYPEADETVRRMALNWPLLPARGWAEVFGKDGLIPDFEGEDLHWIHRRTGDLDIYFMANPTHKKLKRRCVFRMEGKTPELWNPETGKVHALRNIQETDGRITVELDFEPVQSWFIVFSEKSSRISREPDPVHARWEAAGAVQGPWEVRFDTRWGGPDEALVLDDLKDWRQHPDSGIRYYSGTAVYRTSFQAETYRLPTHLDLGEVEVVARVRLNGEDCGIAWKPPYKVDISKAVRAGNNELEVDIANTWVNRMIGDEHLPLDAGWKNWETLEGWPDWFLMGQSSPTGRYTFTTARHYTRESPLQRSGLLGPVRLLNDNRN
jgi:hypothetical protein